MMTGVQLVRVPGMAGGAGTSCSDEGAASTAFAFVRARRSRLGLACKFVAM
jgi:hypothetical protein